MPFLSLPLIMMQSVGMELANLETNCRHSVCHRTLVCTHYIQCYHQNPFRSQDNHFNIFSRNFVENDFTHFYCAWSCVVRRFLPLYLCQKISNCEWNLCIKVTLCPLLQYTSTFFYFALNLASWSLCLLNFIFMKSDTASLLVKGVMFMLYCLPFHACWFSRLSWDLSSSLTRYAVSCTVAKSQTLLGGVWQLWSRNFPHWLVSVTTAWKLHF